MSLQTLFAESYIAISYDHENEWLYVDWQGEHNLSTVQHGATEMLRLLKEQGCHKVLNDNTHVTGMWSEGAEWAGKEWFPTLANAGLQYFAWIYSPNIYSRLSTDLTLQFTKDRPIVATFDDFATAKAWLEQV